MNPTRRTSRSRVAAVLVAPAVVALLAGCWVGGSTTSTAQPAGASTAGAASTSSVRVVLRFDDDVASATLTDTPQARQLAAMLPLQLKLRDPMGQAKSGQLPQPIDVTGVEPIFDPSVGEIYYWPSSSTLAIVYDDLGQSVPPPGLTRLGSVDSGLEGIARAGNRFTVRIDLVDRTSS